MHRWPSPSVPLCSSLLFRSLAKPAEWAFWFCLCEFHFLDLWLCNTHVTLCFRFIQKVYIRRHQTCQWLELSVWKEPFGIKHPLSISTSNWGAHVNSGDDLLKKIIIKEFCPSLLKAHKESSFCKIGWKHQISPTKVILQLWESFV